MTENPSPRADIIASLKPLFDEARAKGLWFWCSYQGLWFSPDDLEKQQRNGSFIWGPTDWRLRDPKEYVAEAQRDFEAAAERLKRAKTAVEANTVW